MDVYEKAVTIALTEINGMPGLKHHPLYELLPLEAYISSPIIVEGSVWGTLNFSSMHIRMSPFNNNDVEFMKHSTSRLSECIDL